MMRCNNIIKQVIRTYFGIELLPKKIILFGYKMTVSRSSPFLYFS